jgi:hypothetical protein
MDDKNNYGKCNSAARHIHAEVGYMPDGLQPSRKGGDLHQFDWNHWVG